MKFVYGEEEGTNFDQPCQALTDGVPCEECDEGSLPTDGNDSAVFIRSAVLCPRPALDIYGMERLYLGICDHESGKLIVGSPKQIIKAVQTRIRREYKSYPLLSG